MAREWNNAKEGCDKNNVKIIYIDIYYMSLGVACLNTDIHHAGYVQVQPTSA